MNQLGRLINPLGRLFNQIPVDHFDDAGVLVGEVGAPRLVRLAPPPPNPKSSPHLEGVGFKSLTLHPCMMLEATKGGGTVTAEVLIP